MNNEELKTCISKLLPANDVENKVLPFGEDLGEASWLSLSIDSSDWLPLAEQLRNNPDLQFDYLFCITAVDWKTHLSVVYHLRSIQQGHIVVVKAKIADRNNAEIETVSHIWRTAEFHEREAYDLMGVKFLHHPDLRRLFMTDEWEGYPLRKDYEDPVNMIKL